MSEHPGCMHACGHDTHTSMLLGAARVLNQNKDKIPGTVKLLFQTGEESCLGARVMVSEGAMDDVDAVFGTHIGTTFGGNIPVGTLICVPGCCMASFDKFIIHIHGMGCHGFIPETGVDPINIAAHIVIASGPPLRTDDRQDCRRHYLQRDSDGRCTRGHHSRGGTRVRMFLAKHIEEISAKVAEAFNGEAKTEMVWGAPPVINDDAMAALAGKAARKVLDEEHILTSVPSPSMGGEDFAYYLEKKPGTFMFLSSANPAKKSDLPHHNSKFMVDEDVFWKGAAVFVSIIEDFFGIG